MQVVAQCVKQRNGAACVADGLLGKVHVGRNSLPMLGQARRLWGDGSDTHER